MSKLSLNSISPSVFSVKANEVADGNMTRASIVGAGRLLTYEHALKGKKAMQKAMNSAEYIAEPTLNDVQYKQLNEKFQAEHFLYAAKKVCEFTGMEAPSNYEEFKRNALNFYRNKQFYAVLQGIYQEIVTPILPAVYSEAVSLFADTINVGFGQTAQISVDSNDIPIFQDAAWGTQRSIPRNRFYSKDYVLDPKPRSCYVSAKWVQLVSNGWDFGRWFANITAGMYAKTMGLWNQAMIAAASDATLIPSGLQVTFSNPNWIALANKIAASNNTSISNVFAFGGAVALSKVLPTTVTGSTNVNMDAAIATLLGADYTRAGYLGEFLSVRLRPLTDVVIPGTQNSTVTTMLPANKVWMMAGNGRKPMTIGYNPEGGITFEIDPLESGDFEIGVNVTFCIDSVSIFSSHVGLVTTA